MDGQASRQQNNALLHSYLRTKSNEESQRLLEELVARAAPLIEKKLGRRFHVALRVGRSPHCPDAEDRYSEVRLLLIEKLLKFKKRPDESPIRDFQSYVEAIAENTFNNQLRKDHFELRSLKDALRYLLSGRTKHKAFALWRSKTGRLVGGFDTWKDKAVTHTGAYIQLLNDPESFARSRLRRDTQSMGRAELLEAILRAVGAPIELDDLVKVVAVLEAKTHGKTISGISDLAEEGYLDRLEEVATAAPTPSDALAAKSDLQLIWEDLGRLTLEQRRVLLLQAQHDVIEVLQRAGIAGIQEIAALLELPPAAVEELRCARALSDARLAQRFGFRKATIMQQRHRARRRMMEWRKRWAT